MIKQPGNSMPTTPGNETIHPQNTSPKPKFTPEEITARLEKELAKGRQKQPYPQPVPTLNTVAIERNRPRDGAPSSSKYAVWSTGGVKNDINFIGDIGHRAEDSLQINNPGDSAYRVTSSPKEEVLDNGFLRPSEGTLGGQKDLLFTKRRAGHITEEEYFAKTANLEQKQEEAIARKRALNATRSPLATRVFARLKKLFLGKPYKSPFTTPSEQHEPRLDTLRTKETPILTQATHQEGWSAYQAADEIPDIPEAEIDSKYPDHKATLAGLYDRDSQPTSKEAYSLTTQPSISDILPKNSPRLTASAPKNLSLSYSKGNNQALSKEQLDALLKTNKSGLTPKQIDDIVDVQIMHDLHGLSMAPRHTTTEMLPDIDTEDLFTNEQQAEEDELERRRKLNPLERLGDWRTRLGKVGKRTKSKLETALEKLGPEGKKLVSSLTQGSEYLNKNIDKRYKIFAGAGLLTAGALAAYASPVVLASIAGAGLGMRVISSAGIYIFARKYLDKKYKQREDEGRQLSTLSKVGHEAGAIGFAFFAGDVIGRIFEGIASSETVREITTSIKNTANLTSISEAWSNFFGGATSSPTTITIPEATFGSETNPVTTPDVTTTPPATITKPEVTFGTEVAPTKPDLEHIVKKGDNLWSLLRGDIEDMKLPRFDELSDGAKERMMREILDDMPVPSGNSDKIFPGDVINFNGIDFQKYLDKQLQK